MRKVLIADSSDSWRELVAGLLSPEYAVRSCGNGTQALALAEEFRPDVLVLDLMLTGTDGLTVIRQLSQWEEHPRFIVTGKYFSDYITGALEQCRVDSIMMKPCTAQCVAEHVAGVLALEEEPPSAPDPIDRITALLVQLGVPTSQQGFRLLRRGIELMMSDPNQQLTKGLYPTLAREFGTSAVNVEKSLRTAVTTAWTRRREEVWRAYFPQSPSGQIPRPRAGQFLSRLADAVAYDLRRRA